MKKSLLILAAVSVLTIISCRSTKTSSPVSESTTITKFCGEWKIISFTGFDKMPDAYMNITYVEDIDSGEELSVNGFSGVNYFFATILGTNSFPLGNNVGSTKMMGSPEEMDFEDAFIQVIASSNDWQVSGNKLTVTYNDKTAVFEAPFVNDK
ncbi:MAG: META domain-containing protein [Treponema sp.]|nr:META domain-containing protein [Treponema sp.]